MIERKGCAQGHRQTQRPIREQPCEFHPRDFHSTSGSSVALPALFRWPQFVNNNKDHLTGIIGNKNFYFMSRRVKFENILNVTRPQ